MSLFTIQGLNYILPLITVPYLTRVLGAENYGKTIFAMAIIINFQVICDYGFNMSATRNISINRDNKSEIEQIFSSVISIKSMFTIIGAFILTIMIFTIPRLREDYILYYFTYISVVGNALFPVWLFQGIEDMKYITYLNVAVKLISTISIFLLIRSSEQYILLPLINSSVLVIIAIISLILIKIKMKINFMKPSYKRILIELKDGWHLFVTSFFSNILSNSGNLIIGTFLGDVMVGYYGGIDKIVKAIISIFAPITTAIFPHTNRELKKSKKDGIKEIVKFAKIVIAIAIVVAIVTILTAKIAVYILCGSEYVQYADILRIQSIWIVISIINNFIGIQFLIGISAGYYYSRSFMIAGAIMICFDIAFINIWGIYTIPFGMIISELSLCIIMLLIIFKKKLYMEVNDSE
nr:oligosaccharide flippase family protein [Clostridium gasigenes]